MRLISLLALFTFAATIPPSEAAPYCAGSPVATAPNPAAKLAQGSRTGTRRALALFARFGDQTGSDLPPSWSADLFASERAGSFAHFYDAMFFDKLRVRGEVAQKSTPPPTALRPISPPRQPSRGSWVDRSAGLPTRQVGTNTLTEPLAALAVDPKEQGTLLISSNQSIWRSDDEGLNWRETSDLYALALAFHPLRPRELYAVSPQGLHRSFDYGANWSLLVGLVQNGYTSTPRLHFAPHDPDRFYLATGPDLLETRDGGQTWDSIGTDLAAYPFFNDVAVDPLQPQFLYAATPWGLYRTDRSTARTHIAEEQSLPAAFALAQNYPNPFNPSTAIRYQIPHNGFTELTIYNLAGQIVRHLLRSEQMEGAYEAIWDGKNNEGVLVGSGVYFYRFRAEKQVQTRRMLLLK